MKELLFILTTSSGTFTLDVSPDGWDSGMITFERSEKYFGVFRSWTMPLKFVKTGALELRREFYTHGQAGQSTILIQKLDKVTMTYIAAFTGVLDFTTFKDTENYVEVTFHDAGVAKVIKDYGGTEYEIENSLMNSATEYNQSDVEFKYDTETYYGVELLTLGYNLLNKMTGGKLTSSDIILKSDYLSQVRYAEFDNEKLIFVPGSQLYYDGARFGSFKTTFEAWFHSLNTVFNLGLGIEVGQGGLETVRIEPKDYFLVNDIAMDFGPVNNLTVQMSSGLLFKTIEIGYDAKTYKNSGLLLKETELNAKTKWEIRTESNNKKLELVSKYRGDFNGVKDAIMSADGDETDDIFFLHLHAPDEAWQVDTNGAVRLIDGPGSPVEAGNLIITPRRNLARWAEYLSNVTYGLDGAYLYFTSAENQIRLYESSRDQVEDYANETDQLQLSQRTRFFPVTFDIEVGAPADFINTLLNNTAKIYTFDFKGNQYGGYIMKVEARIKGKSAQKITFLASNLYQNALMELINRRNG